jgi:hypothetical protein
VYGAPIRASQRHRKVAPTVLPLAFSPGDRVCWNNRYEGVIERVFAEDKTALVSETEILGRKATWRLDLAALTRAPIRP